MDIVNEIIRKDNEDKSHALEKIKVQKLITPECFVQDLLITDTNEINVEKLRLNCEDYLIQVSRDCTQVLINTLCDFPKTARDGKEFIQLPTALNELPREKRIPVPKPLTKWQKFARDKGIKKQKKPKCTWDDILQKWVPRYGYKKVAAEKEKDWLIEVPPNVDPNTDMFAEKSKVKKENIAKNEYQRLRNIAAARKIKVPKVGLLPLEKEPSLNQIKNVTGRKNFPRFSRPTE